MPEPLLSCTSVFGKVVRLSKKTWREKILKNHPEFRETSGYLGAIRETIESPDHVVAGWSGEYLAVRLCEFAQGGPKSICVVYREIDDEGFVITAFFISKLGKLLRRGIVWKNQN